MDTVKIKSALEKLKEILLINDYAILIDLFTNGRTNTAPWMTCPVNMIEKLPENQKKLLQLFHLGQQTENIDEVIGEDVLNTLVEMGFLEKDGNMAKTNNYAIYTYSGLYIIGQKWKPGEESAFDQVWLGEDSLCLARLLPNLRGKKVLDLCAGTGILGMVMAERGAVVKSVELNPSAAKLSRWNFAFNNLEDKINVYEGDLFQPVKGEKFDLIISNPPYIPLIDGEDSGLLFGSAGDDGLKLLRAIIKSAYDYLEPSGKAILIAGGFGDNEKPYISKELGEFVKEKALDINLIVYGKRKAMEELSHIEKVLPSVQNCFSNIGDGDDIHNEQYYHIILTIHKTQKPKGEFNTIFCFSSLRDTFKQLKEGKTV